MAWKLLPVSHKDFTALAMIPMPAAATAADPQWELRPELTVPKPTPTANESNWLVEAGRTLSLTGTGICARSGRAV